MLSCRVDKLECNDLEAALLKTADDGANEAALDAVGLYAAITQISHNGAQMDGLKPALTMM